MSDKLRFGICGLGFMGQSHFARLRAQPAAEVVAVCDGDEQRRRGAWGGTLGNLDLKLDLDQTPDGQVSLEGINAYAQPEELVRDPRVDAVLIALPTPLHAQVAVAALESGKHVLTEKPMAFSVGACDQMIRAGRAHRRTLMVAHCIRFWPQYETIKRYVDEGRIGAVRFVNLRRLGSRPTYSAGNWLLDSAQSGGALLDLHVHDVDFAQWLLGVPDTIRARGTFDPTGGIDHIIATYGYADGRYAIIDGGWTLAPSAQFEMAITVQGERGALEWSMTRGADVLLYSDGSRPESIPCPGDALASEQEYFIECVRAGRPVERCTPVSSRLSVALAWLERRSVETGRQIGLSDRLRATWGMT